MALERLFSGIEQTLRERAAQTLEEGAQILRTGDTESANLKLAEATTIIRKSEQIRDILGNTLSALQEANIDQPAAEFLETLVGERETPPVEPLLIHGVILTELTPARYSALRHIPQNPDEAMPSSQLARLAFPDIAAQDLERAKDRLAKTIFNLKDPLAEVNLAVVNLTSRQEMTRGVEGRYFIQTTFPEQPIPADVQPERRDDEAAKPALSEIVTPEEVEAIFNQVEDFSLLKQHPEMAMFLDRVPPGTRALIEKFLDSQEVSWILTQVKKFIPEDKMDLEDFMQDLAGTVFEYLSYYSLLDQYPGKPDLAFLSPKEVFLLYQKMFPDRAIRNFSNHNLQFGIVGISYPDGLVLRESQLALFVDKVLEYKLWIRLLDQTRLENQLRRFSYDHIVGDFFQPGTGGENDQLFHGRIVNQLRPSISVKPITVSEDLEKIYAVPNNSTADIPDITMTKTPIHSTALGRFLDLLFKVVHEDSAAVESEQVAPPASPASPAADTLPSEDQGSKESEEEKNPVITAALEAFHRNKPELTVFTRSHIRQITGRTSFVSETLKLMSDIAMKHGIKPPTKKTEAWLYTRAALEEICYALGRPRIYQESRTQGQPLHTITQTDSSTTTEEHQEVPELDQAKALLITNILLNPEARKLSEEVFGESTTEEDLVKLSQIADRLSHQVKLPQDVEGLVLETGELLRYFQKNPDAVLNRYQGSDEGIIFTFFSIGEEDDPENLFLKMYEATQNRDSSTPQADIRPADTAPNQEQLKIEPLTEYQIGVLAYYLNANKWPYQGKGVKPEQGYFNQVTQIRDSILPLSKDKLKDTREYKEAYHPLLDKLKAFAKSPQAFLELHRTDPRVNTLLEPLTGLATNDLQYVAEHILDFVRSQQNHS